MPFRFHPFWTTYDIHCITLRPQLITYSFRLTISLPLAFVMDKEKKSEKKSASSSASSETPRLHGDDAVAIGEVLNASGHKQELEANFGLVSLCSIGITVGNVWAALGGSIVRRHALQSLFLPCPFCHPGLLFLNSLWWDRSRPQSWRSQVSVSIC